jgi:hypothetical protein
MIGSQDVGIFEKSKRLQNFAGELKDCPVVSIKRMESMSIDYNLASQSALHPSGSRDERFHDFEIPRMLKGS